MTMMLPSTETKGRETGARVSSVVAAAAAAVSLVSSGTGGQIIEKPRLLAAAKKCEDRHVGGRVAKAASVRILWTRIAHRSPAP